MALTSEDVKVPKDGDPNAFLISVTIFNRPHGGKKYFPLPNGNLPRCTLYPFPHVRVMSVYLLN